jgi:hypothetical protein
VPAKSLRDIFGDTDDVEVEVDARQRQDDYDALPRPLRRARIAMRGVLQDRDGRLLVLVCKAAGEVGNAQRI